jgi:hypothetical protein
MGDTIMKNVVILFIIMIVAINGFLFTSSTCAGETTYSKPEFRGRVIDAETKQPIEGAVAIVLYYKEDLIGGPGGPNSYVFKAKEILTDTNGNFYFPSHSSLHIFTRGDIVRFIFYKPGYMAGSGPINIDTFLWEQYFSADEVGKVAEIHVKQGRPANYKGPMGIVELKKAKTREEKLLAIPSPPTDYTSKELPLFIKIINEAGNNLGLKGGYK